MKKKSAKAKKTLFDSIRKPTAPASQRIGTNKPTEKVLPSLRKSKHKKELDTREDQ